MAEAKMTYVTDHLIEEAAQTIVMTRDMCGNEAEALREFWREVGVSKQDAERVSGLAVAKANGIWRTAQRAAGVAEKYWR
jgi:hypothetical protein